MQPILRQRKTLVPAHTRHCIWSHVPAIRMQGYQSLRHQTGRAIRCRQAQRRPGQQTGRARLVEGPSPAIRHQPDMTAATLAAAPSGKFPPHTASALAAGSHSRQAIPEPAGRSGQSGIRLDRPSSGTTPRIPPAMPASDKSPYPGHAAPAGICSRNARWVIPPLCPCYMTMTAFGPRPPYW